MSKFIFSLFLQNFLLLFCFCFLLVFLLIFYVFYFKFRLNILSIILTEKCFWPSSVNFSVEKSLYFIKFDVWYAILDTFCRNSHLSIEYVSEKKLPKQKQMFYKGR